MITQPKLQPLGNDLFKLLEAYIYEWTKDGERYRVVVPRDFVFDMASTPRIVWPLISPFDLGPAAVPHDWFYRNRGHLDDGSFQRWVETQHGGYWEQLKGEQYYWSRKEVDRLFGRMMRETNVTKWRRRAAYRMVRLCGLKAWLD